MNLGDGTVGGDTLHSTFSTLELPTFVNRWFGTFNIEQHRLSSSVWLFVGRRRSLFVVAESARSARAAARDFVSVAEPRTDRRRKKWVYT